MWLLLLFRPAGSALRTPHVLWLLLRFLALDAVRRRDQWRLMLLFLEMNGVERENEA